MPKGPKGQPTIPADVEARPQRKRLTVSEKRERTAAEWARFVKQPVARPSAIESPTTANTARKRKAPYVEWGLRTLIG